MNGWNEKDELVGKWERARGHIETTRGIIKRKKKEEESDKALLTSGARLSGSVWARF